MTSSSGSSRSTLSRALAKRDMLALIFVSINIGVGTIVAVEAGRPFTSLLPSTSSVLFKIVGIVMEATLFGMFALIPNAVAANSAAVFVNVGWRRLFAKTGSLNATPALSGYIIAKSGRTLLFSAYANDVPEGVSATKSMDTALQLIAQGN